jgi:hypothetical protein
VVIVSAFGTQERRFEYPPVCMVLGIHLHVHTYPYCYAVAHMTSFALVFCISKKNVNKDYVYATPHQCISPIGKFITLGSFSLNFGN